MTHNIYAASSWRNEQYNTVVTQMRNWGHTVYNFREGFSFHWSNIDTEWQKWDAVKYRGVLIQHPYPAQGFMSDYRAMLWADTCVLILPCGRSAHLEAGWFCGAHKRCIILLADGEPELMNLIATDICVDIHELKKALQ